MAQIEVGKEYKNGLGYTVKIVSQSKNENGRNIFLGVRTDDSNRLTGMYICYYNDDGKSALGYNPPDDLDVFDWRRLKRDDVVEVRINLDHLEDLRLRHVAYVTEDQVYVYRYGASSKTYSGDPDDLVRYSPEYVLRQVSTS